MRRRAAAVCVMVVLSGVLIAQSLYVPQRVYATAKRQFADFETLLADLARADVVFVGEQHDNLATHRLELTLLEGLARRRSGVVLSLEMFERDIQEPLAHFLMGHTDETEFLAAGRPWPQYRRDYKPLVDFAMSRSWSVIAANVPRAIAADVSRNGIDALAKRPEAEQAWFARERRCPTSDRYFRRFADAMSGSSHDPSSSGAALDRPTLERYYQAQCLRDETMGESIAQAYTAAAIDGKRPLVVHVTGAFHSDYGDGTVARTRRRLPDKRVVTVTVVPVADLDSVAPTGDDRRRADYLLFTVENPKPTAPPGDGPSAGGSSSAP